MFTRLGYGAEAATWRNIFLIGALELRQQPKPIPVSAGGMIEALTVTQLFDSIAIRIDGKRAWDTKATIRWHFTDSNETYRMELSNGVPIHHPTQRQDPADLTVTLTRKQLLGLIAGAGTNGIRFEGDEKILATIMSLTDQPDPAFAIETP